MKINYNYFDHISAYLECMGSCILCYPQIIHDGKKSDYFSILHCKQTLILSFTFHTAANGSKWVESLKPLIGKHMPNVLEDREKAMDNP